VEALWKPRAPGSHPRRSADPPRKREFIDKDPDATHSRPRSLGLCKQEVAGSIPAGSIEKSLQIGLSAMQKLLCDARQCALMEA